MDEAYSQVAWDQLDVLETTNLTHYEQALDLIEAIFAQPGAARATSSLIDTEARHRWVSKVDATGLAVFWAETDDGPRVEAVFTWP